MALLPVEEAGMDGLNWKEARGGEKSEWRGERERERRGERVSGERKGAL